MDIISPSTLTLLRDKNVQEAISKILQRVADAQTVTIDTGSESPRGGRTKESEPVKVTVRRVA